MFIFVLVYDLESLATLRLYSRVLQPDILRVATGLIDELYDEQFDPNLTNVIDAQTDAVRQTVQNEYQSIVYEWLALVAEDETQGANLDEGFANKEDTDGRVTSGPRIHRFDTRVGAPCTIPADRSRACQSCPVSTRRLSCGT